jgi:hypothetical protein
LPKEGTRVGKNNRKRADGFAVTQVSFDNDPGISIK